LQVTYRSYGSHPVTTTHSSRCHLQSKRSDTPPCALPQTLGPVVHMCEIRRENLAINGARGSLSREAFPSWESDPSDFRGLNPHPVGCEKHEPYLPRPVLLSARKVVALLEYDHFSNGADSRLGVSMAHSRKYSHNLNERLLWRLLAERVRVWVVAVVMKKKKKERESEKLRGGVWALVSVIQLPVFATYWAKCQTTTSECVVRLTPRGRQTPGSASLLFSMKVGVV